MKKIIIAVIVLLVVGVALRSFIRPKKNDIVALSEKSGGVVEKVVDKKDNMAPDFTQPMECKYSTSGQEGGSAESKIQFDGEKYKTEVSVGGMKYYSVSDGKTMYSWTEGAQNGTKMDIDCMENLGGENTNEGASSENATGSEEYQNPQELLGGATGVSCNAFTSIDVSVPAGINFVDQCELLKKQQELLQNYQDQIPPIEGIEMPKL